MHLDEFSMIDCEIFQNFEIKFTPSKHSTYSLDIIAGENGTGKTILLEMIGKTFQRLTGINELSQYDAAMKYQIGNKFYCISEDNISAPTPLFAKINYGNLVQPKAEEYCYIDRLYRIRDKNIRLLILSALIADLASDHRLESITEIVKIKEWPSFTLIIDIEDGQTDHPTVKKLAACTEPHLCYSSEDNYEITFLLENDGKQAAAIIDQFGSGLQLFKELSMLLSNKIVILFEFLRGRIDYVEKYRSLDVLERLSRGELSFLAQMCLLRLFSDDTESLILLDSPDIYFSDRLKRQFVYWIDKIMAGKNNSHIIMTTNSVMSLPDMFQEHIFMLEYGDNGIIASNPAFSLFGYSSASDIVLKNDTRCMEDSQSYYKQYIENVINMPGTNDEKYKKLSELLEKTGSGYYNYKIRRCLLELEPD